MTGSAQNNLNTLLGCLDRPGNSVATLLSKASGGNAHPGGQQIVRGGQDYAAMEQVLTLLDADRSQRNQGLVYRFEPGQAPMPVNSAMALLASVELAPREATFRRASILIAGRSPTAEQLTAVRNGDDNTHRAALRGLMSGSRFKAFAVSATNDRLLTRGADELELSPWNRETCVAESCAAVIAQRLSARYTLTLSQGSVIDRAGNAVVAAELNIGP